MFERFDGHNVERKKDNEKFHEIIRRAFAFPVGKQA